MNRKVIIRNMESFREPPEGPGTGQRKRLAVYGRFLKMMRNKQKKE